MKKSEVTSAALSAGSSQKSVCGMFAFLLSICGAFAQGPIPLGIDRTSHILSEPLVVVGTGKQITIASGGSLVANSGSSVTLPAGLSLGSPLTVANGGTGIGSGTSGGVPYFSGGTTIASSAALTANRIVLGGGTGAAPTVASGLGTTTQVLHGNASGGPTFSAVSLTADVTGTLPLANGGTAGTTAVAAKDSLSTKGSNITSASTTNIAGATGDLVDVTGTTTITALGTANAGVERTVRFTGSLTLTHNATSLILPGSANILTQNGDIARFRSLGSGNWICTNFQHIGAAPDVFDSFPIKAGADLVWEGDSITSGSNLSAGQDFPTLFAALAPIASLNVTNHNVATASETLTNISSEYTSQVYPYRPAATGKDAWLFVLIGTNDVASMTPSSYISSLETYWGTAHTDGFTVVAFTIPMATSYSYATREKLRDINDRIRASTSYDLLLDLNAILPNPSNTADWFDAVHPNLAGNTKIARELRSILITRRATQYPDVDSISDGAGRVLSRKLTVSDSSFAQLELRDSGASTDEKNWDIIAGSGSLQFRYIDDADFAGASWMTVSRSGTTITGLSLGTSSTAVTTGAGLTVTGGLTLSKTITTGGTTGAQTINKTTGSVNFAASATSLTVTNSLVSSTSVIIGTVATNDSTMKSVQCVAGSGSFTIYANAAATAETRVNFLVTN